MPFTKVAPAGIGTEPGSEIKVGDSLLHSTGIDLGSGTGIGATITRQGNATFSGIVTAASFSASGAISASSFTGDGSGLEGVSSSGIGTPLSDDDTSDLNKVYYVNQELSIGSTVTINHPSSAVASYTHYQDLVVTDDADFIVADGDTFIPDVLGIRTSTSTASAATGGRIRAGTITNAGANGAPNFPNGLTGTAGTFTGNLNVGGVLTYEDVTNVDSVGLITARAGINLVGNDLNVGSNIKIGNASGIVTATSFTGAVTGNVTGDLIGNVTGNIITNKILPTTGAPSGGGGGIIQVIGPESYSGTNAVNINHNSGGAVGPTYLGAQFDVVITPKFASSKILIIGLISSVGNANGNATIQINSHLYRHIAGASPVDTGHSCGTYVVNNTYTPHNILHIDAPNTTNAVTYKIYGSGNYATGGQYAWQRTTGTSTFLAAEISA